MRRLFGWLLILLGLLAVVAGGAVAAAVGTDDTLELGPHRLTSSGSALVSAPGVIPYSGPSLTVTATLPGSSARVFIGVGHDVDVRDYLAGTAYTRIDSLSVPWHVETSDVAGRQTQSPSPREVTWWLTTAMNAGSTTASFPLPDAPIDVVVMDLSPDRRAGDLSVDLSVGVVVQGSFAGALAVLLGGVGLVVVGWAVRRARITGRRVAVPRRAAV